MTKAITAFQKRCLQAFAQVKVKTKDVERVKIDYDNQPGVSVVINGIAEFYPLNAIMDPINRLINSPRPKSSQ